MCRDDTDAHQTSALIHLALFVWNVPHATKLCLQHSGQANCSVGPLRPAVALIQCFQMSSCNSVWLDRSSGNEGSCLRISCAEAHSRTYKY